MIMNKDGTSPGCAAKLQFDDIDCCFYCSKCGATPNPENDDISEDDYLKICEKCGAVFQKDGR